MSAPVDVAAKLRGVLVPVTTPFDAVTGEIAPVSFRENLRRWLEYPLDGIVLFGSTGEGALLEDEEKLRLIGFARDLVPPALPLIAGLGPESTRGGVRRARALAEAGADALLVSPPSYFGSALSPAALRDHYLVIAEASPAPVIVYHMPKFTHVVLEPGLVAELARHPNIVGIKDSSGELKRLAGYTEACAGACAVLVGSGALLFSALSLGAAGGIVGIGLLAPGPSTELAAAFRAGDTRLAGEIQERLVPVHREIVARYGAAGVKAALDRLGYAGGVPRPPLRPLSEKDQRDVERVLRAAGLIGAREPV